MNANEKSARDLLVGAALTPEEDALLVLMCGLSVLGADVATWLQRGRNLIETAQGLKARGLSADKGVCQRARDLVAEGMTPAKAIAQAEHEGVEKEKNEATKSKASAQIKRLKSTLRLPAVTPTDQKTGKKPKS